MCILSTINRGLRIRRTIFTPITSPHDYYELERLVQQLMYQRLLYPLTPHWDYFLPWRQGFGVFNVLCFPVLLFLSVAYLGGLMAAPLVSLVVLLLWPLARLCRTQCCLVLTSDYRGLHQSGGVVYYEIKLELAAGYPTAYSSLDSVTDQVLSYLHAHGVSQEWLWVKDGLDWGERVPHSCATIPWSSLTAEDMGVVMAEESEQQQQQQWGKESMAIEMEMESETETEVDTEVESEIRMETESTDMMETDTGVQRSDSG